MGRGRYFGVDECFSETYPHGVIVAAVSRHKRDIAPTSLGKKQRGAGALARMPENDFRYVVLTPETLAVAKDVYPCAETSREASLNGNLHFYKLRKDAIVYLLLKFGFEPSIDQAVVDNYYGRTGVVLEREMVSLLHRSLNRDIPVNCVKCVREADHGYRAVREADLIAYRIAYSNGDSKIWTPENDDTQYFSDDADIFGQINIAEKQIPFDEDDFLRLHPNRRNRK